MFQGEKTAEIGSGGCTSWGIASNARAENGDKTEGVTDVRHRAAENADQEEVVDLCESEEETVTVTEVGGFARCVPRHKTELCMQG